jgi:hypothetical protein
MAEHRQRMGDDADAPSEHHPLHPPARAGQRIDRDEAGVHDQVDAEVGVEAFHGRDPPDGTFAALSLGEDGQR